MERDGEGTDGWLAGLEEGSRIEREEKPEEEERPACCFLAVSFLQREREREWKSPGDKIAYVRGDVRRSIGRGLCSRLSKLRSSKCLFKPLELMFCTYVYLYSDVLIKLI